MTRDRQMTLLCHCSFRFARSAHVQTSVEHNLHRSDTHRRATLLVEISSLNHVQLVVRCLQYDIVKIPINHQTTSTNNHFRQVSEREKCSCLSLSLSCDPRCPMTRMSFPNRPNWKPSPMISNWPRSFAIRPKRKKRACSPRTSLSSPSSKTSSSTILRHPWDREPPCSKVSSQPCSSNRVIERFSLAIIRHSVDTNKRAADTYLFKYVLENASIYNIQSKKRNVVSTAIL